MIAFICGPSGSGKTTTIRDAHIPELGIELLRASEILHKLGRPTSELAVDDVSINQKVLFDWLQNTLLPERNYVLDSHLIIRSTDRYPIAVNQNLFSKLPVCGFVMIRDKFGPLLARAKSKYGDISPDELAILTAQEEASAKQLAQSLKVQFKNVRSLDGAGLRRAIRRMFGHVRKRLDVK